MRETKLVPPSSLHHLHPWTRNEPTFREEIAFLNEIRMIRMYSECHGCGVAWIDPFEHPESAGLERHAENCMFINQDKALMTQFRENGGDFVRVLE